MGKVVALIGAGGKMGCRIADNLKASAYDMKYVETGERGIAQLAQRGWVPTAQEEAVPEADIVIMAVPDIRIGAVAASVAPLMKSGAMMILLDPAAAYLNQLPDRADVAYFVSHPCHPPVFNDETSPEARRDYFGGVKAKQAIVCALVQGGDAAYATGEAMAKEMFAPVFRSHRITLEQMAILEPTMAETVSSMLATLMREAMDEAVNRGVPYEAARDFMLGHVHIQLAIVFGEAGNPFSDACKIAIEYGKRFMIQPDWRRLFEPSSVYEQIDVMLHPEKLNPTG
ncbi:phosphogluconate dehydrogenase C-terminal domain-containing protein [Cohnella sp. JJ-181]|uniref:phosphogluconate dehydrogenase C-terminal domain-containing protein n=1 Tax=Cohnella rhizoplanae TaxID=2974897 RepID=UPI0022FFA11F|nr:phosphogluconate dehydrogenase C-terminal domain-containing protein [Cohnella sp. JJ-181]CAI6052121.1 D-apionate oxidoisomerase [Cohnella sp. JJ-181]